MSLGQIIKCYVHTVVSNPGDLTQEELANIRSLVDAGDADPPYRQFGPDIDKNPLLEKIDEFKVVNDMPRNTIVALPIGPTDSVEDEVSFILCYPFFSSHFTLPIKEGECVWVFSESGFDDGPDYTSSGPFFWVTRVHGSLISEDVNYAHYDRKYEKINLNISDKDAGKGEIKDMLEAYKPTYPIRIFDQGPGVKMVNERAGYEADEAVPRYSKRDGDLILQGSNNTLICLGTTIDSTPEEELLDKTKAYDFDPEEGMSGIVSNGALPNDSYGGAIDIVVGRGTGPETLRKQDPEALDIKYPTDARPSIAQNADGYEETKKNPTLFETGEANAIRHPRYYNLDEGNPNLSFDASRIYAARDIAVDDDFKIHLPFVNSFYPEGNPDPGKESGNPDKIEDIGRIHVEHNGPAIAVKSKNIRIIARSTEYEVRSIHTDDKTEVKLIGEQGSIVILKEGVLDPPFDPEADPSPIAEHASKAGNGRAIISLAADGTIYIDGPRIVIGSGQDKEIENGEGIQLSFGLEATEPIVMGNTLNETLQAFMEEMIKFIDDTFTNHGHATGTGPSGPCGSGSDAGDTPGKVGDNNTKIQEQIDRLKLHLSKLGKTK